MKITITLTMQQANNLIIFLLRARLTGEEAETFQDIVDTIKAAKPLNDSPPKRLWWQFWK